MVFINWTDVLGVIIYSSAENTTGDLFISLLTILLMSIIFCILLRIPIEFTLAIVLPLVIVPMAYMGEFVAPGGILLIYIALLSTKYFFLRG